MNETVKKELLLKARDMKVPCALARKIAEDLGVKYKDVGAAANELGVKINNCELGCF
jgi:hypothetical protein